MTIITLLGCMAWIFDDKCGIVDKLKIWSLSSPLYLTNAVRHVIGHQSFNTIKF